jgi:hypothetical protein
MCPPCPSQVTVKKWNSDKNTDANMPSGYHDASSASILSSSSSMMMLLVLSSMIAALFL